MSARHLILLSVIGSAALLLAAFAFQHLGGLPPCKLCIWQRWPHVAAVVIGGLALMLNRVELAWLGALAALTTAGIGLYHVGVEQGWWEGPTTCTAGSIGNLSTEALMDQIMNAPLVRCDDVAWAFAGVSMAGWNMVISAFLALLWIAAPRRA